mgnify:CR=1 FL=1
MVEFKGIFKAPPTNVPSEKVVDGPIIGNGDVGVVLSGLPQKQRLWISKVDFWKQSMEGPLILASHDDHEQFHIHDHGHDDDDDGP